MFPLVILPEVVTHSSHVWSLYEFLFACSLYVKHTYDGISSNALKLNYICLLTALHCIFLTKNWFIILIVNTSFLYIKLKPIFFYPILLPNQYIWYRYLEAYNIFFFFKKKYIYSDLHFFQFHLYGYYLEILKES